MKKKCRSFNFFIIDFRAKSQIVTHSEIVSRKTCACDFFRFVHISRFIVDLSLF